MYQDANGNAYQARTNEYPGFQPDELTYYPVGTRIESSTPEGKQGVTFNTKYAILGATLKGMTPNAKQDTFHEAVNDQGMSFSANAFTYNEAGKITVPADKVLSAMDFGAWSLGSFKNVRELKQAIERKDIEVWLPPIASMWNLHAPIHFAYWDRSGEGIVVEFTGGKIVAYDNLVGAMTNDPPFPWHLDNLKNYAGLTNKDKNAGQFSKLKVSAPDSGGALASLPSSNMSPDRFVKAAFYVNYAKKAKTSEEAVQTLSHVINNFDRPLDITIDEPGGSGGEAVASKQPTSEATYFTVMNDLSQSHFYIRTIKMINFVRFDLKKMSGIKSVKTVSFAALNSSSGFDGTELFTK
jgi:penicillin V acylase-like amidase (Ntn superfamily)